MTASRIGIIHLSDIHFKEEKDTNKVLGKADQIISAVRSSLAGVKFIYIAVTGDIAQSALDEQYKIAKDFLITVRDSIARDLQADVKVLICPGNHDCDLSKPSGVRDLVITNSIKSGSFDSSIIETCLSVQGSFRSFCRQVKGESGGSESTNELYAIESISGNGHALDFIVINTAWVSRNPETSGTIWFPEEVSGEIERHAAKEGTIVVSLFHHPYSWIEADNGRKFKRAVEYVSDIILTGHEHDPGSSHRTSGDLESNLYIEGGALQDWWNIESSAFNVISIDQERSEYKAATYRYSAKRKIYEPMNGEAWRPFQRNKNKIRNQFSIGDEFRVVIEDAGTGFRHSRKTKVLLPDIFVYPNFLSTSRKTKQKDNVKGKDFIQSISRDRKIVINGPERSGKTSVAKAIYSDLHSIGVIPVAVTPESIKKKHVVSEDLLMEGVRECFREQYKGDHFEEYRQLPPAKRALIIDDFGRMGITSEDRRSFLKIAANLFDIIVILSGEDEMMSELLYGEGEVSDLIGYVSYEIQPMGNAVRGSLIRKWCALGRETSAGKDEIEQAVEDAEKQINGVLSKSIVPSYPLFVLMLLQARETQFQGGIANCTYGPLYQHLIVTSLKEISDKPAFLDITLTMLAMVAYKMFEVERPHLTHDEFNSVISRYEERYGITIDRDSILSGLVSKTVLKKTSKEYTFSYSYYYYYFVSIYIKDHLDKKELKYRAEYLAENCHTEWNTNILLFLSSLSKDESVTDAILAASDKILPGKKPYNVTEILGLPDDALSPSARLAIVQGSSTGNREKYHETIDQTQYEDRSDPAGSQAEMEFIDLTKGAKIIQIIGQILCTSPGSLNAESKYFLVRSGYDLSLRCMSYFHDLIKSRHQEIKGRLVPYLHARHPDKSADELRKLANGIVTNVVQAVIFGMIKHVSGCVGHEALTKTYAQIMDLHENVSDKVLDLSIKIDHTRPFPAEETVELYEEMAAHRNTRDLIRNLAWQRFHLFNVPSRVMQSVCVKLDIEYKPSMFLNPDDKQTPKP